MTDRNCTIQNLPKQVKNKAKYSTVTFIKKAIEVHGNEYLYEKTIYTNIKSKLIITCPKHGL